MKNFVAVFKMKAWNYPLSNPWLDARVLQETFCNNETQANSIARELSRDYRCEIRWNNKGLNQGHYISNYTNAS